MIEATPPAGSAPLKNAKHEAVLQAWIADPARVWWKAWQSVYPKSQQRAAEVSASRLLKDAEFCARRDSILGQVAERVMSAAVMSQVEVLEELSKLGRSNLKKALVDGDDTADVVQSLREMPDDVAATIKTLTIETFVEGSGKDARDVRRVKIEQHDKKGALSELRRHYEPQRHELSGPGGGPIETEATMELSPLDIARRIAFVLERGKRELGKQKTSPAPAAAKRKPKKKPASEARPAAAAPATAEPKKDPA